MATHPTNNLRRNQHSTLRLGWLSSLFITFAGSDKSILRRCSQSEITKHASIGATIFATALLACLSGGYAIYTVFRNESLGVIDTEALWYAAPFGLIWGFFVIFNLDRFIVSTFRKSGNFGRELLQASPRIVLAIIIAIVISKPIEIKIFESRLAEQIQIHKQKAEAANQAHYTGKYGIADTEGIISNLDTVIGALNTELADDPQNIKDMISNELEPAESELAAISDRNNAKIIQHNRNISAIRSNPSNYRPDLDAEGNEIYVNGRRKESLTREARSKIGAENSAITVLKKEIEDQKEKVKGIKLQITTAREEYKTRKKEEIAVRKQEKSDKEAQLKKDLGEANKEIDEANVTSAKAFSNNFITQLEALGNLTDYKQYKVGSPERAEARIMSLASWAIMMLLLVIELAPVLTKLITKRGSYDELLDEEEDKINFIARYENIANKFLVRELSTAQREVLNEAIKKWKEQEMENDNLAQNYIN